MADYLVSDEELTSIADAIRTKGGTSDPLTWPDEYVDAIGAISGGGGGSMQSKTATPTESTQTIRPDTGYDGLSSVTVNPIPSQYIVPTGTKSITANGTGIDVTEYAAVDVAVPSSAPTLQAKTATPTTSQQTITADSGYDGLSSVTVSAMPSGTAGTPTATKGTVSNHSVSVTPSVTNTTGYITGSTKTGTAVTVTASELVSGSQTITENGTVDVTNLASVTVNVAGSDYLTLLATKSLGTISTTSTTATDTGQTLAITGFDAYDLLICIAHTSPHTNNRHVATVRLLSFAATSNVDTKTSAVVATSTQHYKLSSSGTLSERTGTTPYGVYVNAGTISTSGTRTLTLTIYQRYNSTSSGTINGSYVLDVYGVKLQDLF